MSGGNGVGLCIIRHSKFFLFHANEIHQCLNQRQSMLRCICHFNAHRFDAFFHTDPDIFS